MTRDELLDLVQKLDERGASEQEIATVVDSYRSELTIPVKKTSPVKHIDITDMLHDPNVQHNGEEVTTTPGQAAGDVMSDAAEVDYPEETTVEHIMPEEFGLEGYEKYSSQITDNIGYEDYLIGQLKNKYPDFKFEPAYAGMSGLKITPVTGGESIKLLGGFNEPGAESEQEGIGTNVLNLSNITKYIEENLPDQELHSEEIKVLKETGLTPEDYPSWNVGSRQLVEGEEVPVTGETFEIDPTGPQTGP